MRDNSPNNSRNPERPPKRARWDEALREYREAIRLQPQFVSALMNLSWGLATDPNPTGQRMQRQLRYGFCRPSHLPPKFASASICIVRVASTDANFSKL